MNSWSNIPAELRKHKNWVVSGENKIPLNPRTGQRADVTDSSTWGSFEEAISAGHKSIGFVLSENDDYCIIDLDNKPSNPATPEQLARHSKIIESFKSYTEISVSGSGVHIVIKGKIPQGKHRDHVEAYSQERYMIFTGNVLNPYPIENRQELLDVLFAEMGHIETSELEQIDSDMSDAEIFERASEASNAEKFLRLCDGGMQGYPSQSEADFALMSIIAFYTKDNEQVRRIFRYTKLGKRDKAQRNAYLDYALSKIRGNEVPTVDASKLLELANRLTAQSKEQELVETVESADGPTEQFSEVNAPVEFPIGIIGEMAEYFYSTAIRPVREIALAAAIALTAGVTARSYNISGAGLNQYLILLARTGSGKEGALSGIDTLLASVRPVIPMADQFIGPSAFSSGQALIKVLNEKPCFVSVLGEFGLTLQQLSDLNVTSSERMLKKVLLDLYSKSGHNQVLRSSVYSDVEKNTKIVQAPNVTILGESTPETFYDGLSASMIAEGLIPRFTIIEYKGDRPKRNPNPNQPPSNTLKVKFTELITSAITVSNNNSCVAVTIAVDALELLDGFDSYADKRMNSKSEADVQLWNRAHLKALKLSGLIAVGVNPHQPLVTQVVAEYAIKFIHSEITNIAERFHAGDIGNGESKQISDLKAAVKDYFFLTDKLRKSYGINDKLFELKVIPYTYLSRKLVAVASYKKDKIGATNAIKRNIQVLIDSGDLDIIAPAWVLKNAEFGGVCYSITKSWLNNDLMTNDFKKRAKPV